MRPEVPVGPAATEEWAAKAESEDLEEVAAQGGVVPKGRLLGSPEVMVVRGVGLARPEIRPRVNQAECPPPELPGGPEPVAPSTSKAPQM